MASLLAPPDLGSSCGPAQHRQPRTPGDHGICWGPGSGAETYGDMMQHNVKALVEYLA
ncbi:MAG: hypothetical protein HC918_11100 [Oscillatoriales cyanobacterium SM2_1_8]|nr:hypothetical protein [Oscillatoriales cyanobacterium SM2_1_8]